MESATPFSTSFANQEEAKRTINALQTEIDNIKHQLATRPGNPNDPRYNVWRQKAKQAIMVKAKQMNVANTWIKQQAAGSAYRPNLGNAIQDNIFEISEMFAKFKRRAYADYRIAKAVFNYLLVHGSDIEVNPEIDEITLWLERANMPVEQIYITNPHLRPDTGSSSTDEDVSTFSEDFSESEEEYD